MSRVSIRYAKALFMQAQEEKKLDAVTSDMTSVQELMEANSDFKNFVLNPLVTGSKKSTVVGSLFANKLDSLSLNFLHLLCTKKRLGFLEEILDGFAELIFKYKKQILVNVTSAKELEKSQLTAMKSNLEKMTDKTVVFKENVDISLIGGFTLQIEDTVIDNSVRSQLTKLKEQLVS